MKNILCLLVLMLMLACVEEQKERLTADEYVSAPYRLKMEKRTDSLYVVRLFVDSEQMDTLTLPYPVYRFDAGDLTGDGVPELTVGVTKPTKYWKEPARRLFIYHLYHERYIRPLWLGSRVGSPLVDFHVCRDSIPAVIHTVELHPDSTTFSSEYRLQGFGLKFVKNLGAQLTINN